MARRRSDVLDELTNAWRRNQTLADRVDEAAGTLMGVNRSGGRCLDVITREGRVTPGLLATETGLTTGAVTGVLDRLEQAGLVRRLPDPDDRRRVLVEATERVGELAADIYGPIAMEGHEILESYSAAQLELFADFMLRANELSERHAQRLEERIRERRR